MQFSAWQNSRALCLDGNVDWCATPQQSPGWPFRIGQAPIHALLGSERASGEAAQEGLAPNRIQAVSSERTSAGTTALPRWFLPCEIERPSKTQSHEVPWATALPS